jgi:hypothetical protein
VHESRAGHAEGLDGAISSLNTWPDITGRCRTAQLDAAFAKAFGACAGRDFDCSGYVGPPDDPDSAIPTAKLQGAPTSTMMTASSPRRSLSRSGLETDNSVACGGQNGHGKGV